MGIVNSGLFSNLDIACIKFLLSDWHTLHLAAEKSKGEAMERVLAAEQNKVTDLNNKLSFYGDAYKRLQGKLAGAETAVTNIKKELAAQKKKYTELANKFAMTVKELEGGYCIFWWLEPTYLKTTSCKFKLA
jgi:hypothetical protein